MTMKDEEYIALKNEVVAAYRHIPGVHGFGLGVCYKNGVITGETAIQVFVEKKKREGDLAPEHILPKSYKGVRVDVIELPRAENVFDPDRDKYRPVQGGISISKGSGYGTLGCFVKPAGGGDRMLLTNHHVLDTLDTGNDIYQPSKQICNCCNCCPTVVAELSDKKLTAEVDAATGKLVKDSSNCIVQMNVTPTGSYTVTVSEASTGTYKVRKRGAKTRLTHGVVKSVEGTPTVEGRDTDSQMLVKLDPDYDDEFMCAGGDSGSVIINEANEVVGLLFAGKKEGGDYCWANMIANVTSLLEIEIDTSAADEALLASMRAGVNRANRRELAEIVERELLARERGRRYVRYYYDHRDEIMKLVNEQPRIAATWRRNNGPELFQRALSVGQDPSYRLPAEVDGKPTEDCVHRILDAFYQYGSPTLCQGVEDVRRDVDHLVGSTYDELLMQLDAASVDASRTHQT